MKELVGSVVRGVNRLVTYTENISIGYSVFCKGNAGLKAPLTTTVLRFFIVKIALLSSTPSVKLYIFKL